MGGWGPCVAASESSPIHTLENIIPPPPWAGEGHVAAVRKLLASPGLGCVPYNLGTGTGTTVLEMVHAFEAASGLKVNLNLTDRRPGDAQAVWAATETAEKELGCAGLGVWGWWDGGEAGRRCVCLCVGNRMRGESGLL